MVVIKLIADDIMVAMVAAAINNERVEAVKAAAVAAA
jgi:hypothetical protein